MRVWRLIALSALTLLPFGLAGILGARHVPSALPMCLKAAPVVDFERAPIDGIWLRQLEISNCGGAPLPLDAVGINPDGGEGAFTVLGAAPSTLPVDAPLTLTIGFTPERLGAYRGALHIASGGRPLLEVGLSGEGVSGTGPAGFATGLLEEDACGAPLPGGFVARSGCPPRPAPRLAPAAWIAPQPESPSPAPAI